MLRGLLYTALRTRRIEFNPGAVSSLALTHVEPRLRKALENAATRAEVLGLVLILPPGVIERGERMPAFSVRLPLIGRAGVIVIDPTQVDAVRAVDLIISHMERKGRGEC